MKEKALKEQAVKDQAAKGQAVKGQAKDWTPRRWLRILLPAVLVIVWLALAGLGGPTFGKIS